jgi:hypothetical protein
MTEETKPQEYFAELEGSPSERAAEVAATAQRVKDEQRRHQNSIRRQGAKLTRPKVLRDK